MRAALCLAAAWLAVTPALPAQQPIGDFEFLGLATIPGGSRLDDTPVGGLSGITYDRELDRYYAISDDPSFRAPARFYTLKLDLSGGRLAKDGVEIEAVTTLTDRQGRPFDELVMDGEGIALTPSRSLLVSSEGNVKRNIPPSLRELGLDGRERHEYHLPNKWLALEGGRRGVRNNQAFEALTIPPGGESFVTATENALHQDGPAADVGRRSRVRISRFETRSGKLEAEHVYVVEPVVDPPVTSDAFRTNGLVELAAVSDDSFLALERSFSLGAGNSIRLYLISTAGADDVRQLPSLRGKDGIRPVSKRLLIDFDDLGLRPDNVEGMTFGRQLADGRRSLILVSDDNFSGFQTTQIFAFAVTVGETRLSAIQGRGHRSPLEGRWIADARGVTTAVALEGRRPGFWIQEPEGDGNPGTSEALFVSLENLRATVEVGDLVSVSGRVVEAARPGELSTTLLVANDVQVVRRGLPVPEPVRLGSDGLVVPPTIDDDGLTSFDPDGDAIDLYESLEGMRVSIRRARVVGPTTRFGTFTVAIDGGDGAHTARGGLLLRSDDANTERLAVDGSLIGGVPDVEVGRPLAAPLVGVLDYAFGSFRLVLTGDLRLAEPSAARLEDGFVVDHDRLSVAAFNVENLDIGDSSDKFRRIAGSIAHRSPDIVALQEIQDDSGTVDDGTVSAAATMGRLIEAIRGLDGPSYRFAQLDPRDNADGGAPGGNIRVAFLYNPARVRLVERDSRLGSNNPKRLFESSPAFVASAEIGFEATRKPLAAEFDFEGRRIVAINVHLKSKRGDQPLFGSHQPPLRPTETQRLAQAREVGAYVASLLALDPEARIIVLGDFNEHEFRPPMRLLADYGLVDLIERVPPEERYTYNFEGNSQVLDHVLVSPALAARAATVEVLHVNADSPESHRSSDHDPILTTFELAPSLE